MGDLITWDTGLLFSMGKGRGEEERREKGDCEEMREGAPFVGKVNKLK